MLNYLITKLFMKTFLQPSFSAQFVYKYIPENHYLLQVDKLVDWNKYSNKIKKNWYKWEWDIWQPMINPVILFKMLFLCHLYNISEREVEEQVNFNIVMKYFCDLVPEDRSPDHSTLSIFKERILETNKKLKKNILKELFNEIINKASKLWLTPSSMRIIDAGHIVSNVNQDKENQRKKESEKNNDNFTPRDKDAKWWCKKSITVDKDKKIPLYFHWYKEHTSYDPYKNLITEIELSSWNKFDGKFFQKLLNKELSKNKSKSKNKNINIKLVSADKAYDDWENHLYLKDKWIKDAIILKNTRLNKKDKNKEIWEELSNNMFYKFWIKKRKLIEKIYWDQKKWHWLWKCRYLWKDKTKIQVFMTWIVFNLKSIIKQIYNIKFKNQSYLYSTG